VAFFRAVLFRQLRVLDAASPFHQQTADIRVEDGLVVAVAASLDAAEGETVLDMAGACVSPGWTDLFADYREPGYEQKETIASGLETARAGGFTDVCLVPNTLPALDNATAVRAMKQRGGGHPVRLHPLGAVTAGTEGKSLAEMYDMRAAGAVAFTDGWKSVQNPVVLLKALEYVKALDGLVIQMPVDDALAAGGLMHEGPVSTRLGMAGIPAIGETIAVQRAIEVLRYTGSRLHLTGISTKAAVDAVRAAKAEGLNLSCSVAPYHLLFTDDALTGYESVYKVSPPLREEADRQALIEALADGTIDCIASHHRPQDWDAKTREFEYAGEGMALQQLVLGVVLKACAGAVSIERITDALGAAPRRVLRLPDASLAVGKPARLTIFDPTAETHFTEDVLLSCCQAHPFVDAVLPGRVLRIVSS